MRKRTIVEVGGTTAKHFVRNEEVPLNEKEFRKRAVKYVSLLYSVFVRWAGAAENYSHGAATWQTMNEAKREATMREFFELYLI